MNTFFTYYSRRRLLISLILLFTISVISAQEKTDAFIGSKKIKSTGKTDSIAIFIQPYNIKAVWIATLSNKPLRLSGITLFLNDYSQLHVNDSCLSVFKNGTLINFPSDFFYSGNSFITQIKFNYSYIGEISSPATLNFTAIYNPAAYSIIKDGFYRTYYEQPKERIHLPGVRGRTAIPYEWNDSRSNWNSNLGAKNNQ